MTGRHHLGFVAAVATLLAAAPLLAIFQRWSWLFQCLVVIAAITAAAAGARSLRAPRWSQPVAMLAAMTVALTWLFPSGEEILAILPAPGTLRHFAVLVGEAPAAMRNHAIPVPDNDALLFVTALGVGLVAILVDLCAVELRRPALAGLPMLAIYSVPVAVRGDSVPVVPFLIGALGYLWLLGADNVDRVRRFGRRFTGDGRDVDAWQPSPLAAAGRRLAVIGLLLAVVLPLAAPSLTGVVDRVHTGFGGGGSGTGSGSGEVNLFAELNGRLNQDVTEEMVRVTTDDPDPFYLRFAVASEITDAGFGPRGPVGSPVTGQFPAPLARPATGVTQGRYTANVQITEQFNMPMAPTYAELVSVNGLSARWQYDAEQQIVFSNRARTPGLNYRFDYVRSDFSRAALRQAPELSARDPLRQLTEVPEVPEVSELVATLTAGAETPYDQVLAIFRHFSIRNGFRYSLETGPETTGVAIVDFLENQAGYCVQYAAAMAWMVREAGIPARVAIGFTRGSNLHEDTYTLTNRNLHAWTEVYFSGFGWVPFDATPTASIAGGIDTDWAPNPDTAGSDTPDEAIPDQSGDPAGELDRGLGADDPAFADDGDISGGGSGAAGPRWPWLALGGAVLLLALLSIPGLSRGYRRRERLATRRARGERHRAHAAWDELLDTMVDYRLPLDPTETPRATAQRLATTARLGGSTHDDARLLGHAEERARYAPEPLPPDGFAESLRAVRRALAGGATRGARLQAVLLPPSVLRRWRTVISEGTARAADVLSRSNEQLARTSPRRLLHLSRRPGA